MATFYTPKSGKPKKQPQGKAFELTIDEHDHAGNGLCLSSTPITIVPDALAGEVCQVRYSKQSKKVNFATTHTIIKPSVLRIEPFCEYYMRCGGCSLQHTNAKHGLALKQDALKVYVNKHLQLPRDVSKQSLSKKSLSKNRNSKNALNHATSHRVLHHSGAWEKPVLSDIDYSDDMVNTDYRRRVRLAVDARNKQNVKIGFRAEGSDAIIDIPKCAVASSAINDCLPSLRQTLAHLPSIHKVGHIVITQGEVALQVALFTSQMLCKKSLARLSELAYALTVEIVIKAKGEDPVCLHSNSDDGQSSDYDKSAYPQSAVIIEDVPSTKLAIESGHFLQVNKAVNQGLIKRAKAWLKPTDSHTLYDFFCGSGNFALAFAHHVRAVKGYEGVKDMVDVARVNANNMDVENCHFSTADLSSTHDLDRLHFEKNALAILDPSREGALELCQFLANKGIEKILYVSCNPNSFARDASYLLPQYELSKIAALDMFPFTKHIEMMGLFTLRT